MDDAVVQRHIMACDRMYEEAYGKLCECDETSACKAMIRLGMELDRSSLPAVCIRQCERWSLNFAQA